MQRPPSSILCFVPILLLLVIAVAAETASYKKQLKSHPDHNYRQSRQQLLPKKQSIKGERIRRVQAGADPHQNLPQQQNVGVPKCKQAKKNPKNKKEAQPKASNTNCLEESHDEFAYMVPRQDVPIVPASSSPPPKDVLNNARENGGGGAAVHQTKDAQFCKAIASGQRTTPQQQQPQEKQVLLLDMVYDIVILRDYNVKTVYSGMQRYLQQTTAPQIAGCNHNNNNDQDTFRNVGGGRRTAAKAEPTSSIHMRSVRFDVPSELEGSSCTTTNFVEMANTIDGSCHATLVSFQVEYEQQTNDQHLETTQELLKPYFQSMVDMSLAHPQPSRAPNVDGLAGISYVTTVTDRDELSIVAATASQQAVATTIGDGVNDNSSVQQTENSPYHFVATALGGLFIGAIVVAIIGKCGRALFCGSDGDGRFCCKRTIERESRNHDKLSFYCDTDSSQGCSSEVFDDEGNGDRPTYVDEDMFIEQGDIHPSDIPDNNNNGRFFHITRRGNDDVVEVVRTPSVNTYHNSVDDRTFREIILSTNK